MGQSLAWLDKANCAGLPREFFFPPRGADVAAAKEVCKSCTVLNECYVFSMENWQPDEHGIVAGMTYNERKVEVVKYRKRASA